MPQSSAGKSGWPYSRTPYSVASVTSPLLPSDSPAVLPGCDALPVKSPVPDLPLPISRKVHLPVHVTSLFLSGTALSAIQHVPFPPSANPEHAVGSSVTPTAKKRTSSQPTNNPAVLLLSRQQPNIQFPYSLLIFETPIKNTGFTKQKSEASASSVFFRETCVLFIYD